jgi:hypothetical protein
MTTCCGPALPSCRVRFGYPELRNAWLVERVARRERAMGIGASCGGKKTGSGSTGPASWCSFEPRRKSGSTKLPPAAIEAFSSTLPDGVGKLPCASGA